MIFTKDSNKVFIKDVKDKLLNKIKITKILPHFVFSSIFAISFISENLNGISGKSSTKISLIMELLLTHTQFAWPVPLGKFYSGNRVLRWNSLIHVCDWSDTK